MITNLFQGVHNKSQLRAMASYGFQEKTQLGLKVLHSSMGTKGL